VAAAAVPKSTGTRSPAALIALLLSALTLALAVAALVPQAALADGPLAPIAVNYRATITHAPRGVDAQVVDGYLTFWMRVAAGETVTVLDYRNVPWVRYDRSGVWINRNSEEYYLSQIPVPETPPSSLSGASPRHWVRITTGHTYEWRDGRLHAFAAVALTPGASYVGPWNIPLLVDGRRTTIGGAVDHRGPPSVVWFWPIAVMFASTIAGWRIRRETLDRRLERILTAALLPLIALAGAARYLHGRPEVTAGELVVLGLILIATIGGAARLASGRSGYVLLFAVALGAIWLGLMLSPALVHGYVLLALPAFVDRATSVLLLGGGGSLILLALRALDRNWARARTQRRAARVTA
jgi:hypothetical protein